MTTQTIIRPLYLDQGKGFPKSIPSGAILDVGGVAGPTFTVGGRELMFADGTSTGPNSFLRISLQQVYDNSGSRTGPILPASIALAPGKHFVIKDDNTSNVYLKVDADTGKVTISGELLVLGQSSVINTTVIDADHYQITPNAGTTVALRINPDSGVTMSADLVNISALHNGPSVFSISSDGTTNISSLSVSGNIALTGLLNGVDVVAVRNALNQHTSVSINKHQAKEINLFPGTFTHVPYPIGTTIHQVQTILEFLDESINNIGTQVNGLHIDVDNLQDLVDSNNATLVTKTNSLQSQIDHIQVDQSVEPKGFTFVADTPMIEWVVTHNKNSKNFIYILFDGDDFQTQPDAAKIIDANTFVLSFGSPQSGRVNMIFYNY